MDNRGGAGAVIATILAAKAAPDGYTLLLGSSSGIVTNPLLQAKLPYDPFKDFDPVIDSIATHRRWSPRFRGRQTTSRN